MSDKSLVYAMLARRLTGRYFTLAPSVLPCPSCGTLTVARYTVTMRNVQTRKLREVSSQYNVRTLLAQGYEPEDAIAYTKCKQVFCQDVLVEQIAGEWSPDWWRSY